MPHIDPERIALFAIGEPLADQEENDHLASCPTCIDDLAALRHAVIAGRASMDVGGLETPPEAVWSRIVDELQLTSFETRIEEADAGQARTDAGTPESRAA